MLAKCNLAKHPRRCQREQHKHTSEHLRFGVGIAEPYVAGEQVVSGRVALERVDACPTRCAARAGLANGPLGVGAQRAHVVANADADARVEAAGAEQARLLGAHLGLETATAERHVVEQVLERTVAIYERADHGVVQCARLGADLDRVDVAVQPCHALAYALERPIMVVG